ncbi:hypothetical protein [Bacillus dakarensis]|nr:hypothetical protein [Bacillus dakarensis]
METKILFAQFADDHSFKLSSYLAYLFSSSNLKGSDYVNDKRMRRGKKK